MQTLAPGYDLPPTPYEIGALSPVASLHELQIQAVREKFKHKFLLFTPKRCILADKLP